MNGHEPFDLLSYLALGDSYSSGTGSTSYLGGTGFGFQDGNECLRSINSYSEVLDKYFGNPSPNKKTGDSPTFLFHACNGAVINDFTHPQITDDHKKVPPQLVTPDLSFGSVGLVTFTIGGNDALFARVMKYCATRTKTHQTCQARWSRAVDDSLATIEPRLVHLYQQVRDTAKLATGGEVIALGYPRFFPPGQAKQCPTGVPFHHFLPSDMAWINNEIFRIDAKIQKAARTAGIVFVDAYRAFRNHELCDKHPYLNYIVFVPAAAKFVESYHPKAKGQSVLAQLIESRLTKTQG